MLQLPIKNNKYLIVGSYALGVRPAKDIDIICYAADIECEHKLVDDYIATFKYNGMQVECLLADKQKSLTHFLEYGVMEPDNKAHFSILYALKAGHIARPGKFWEKHIHDYHMLRKLVDLYCDGDFSYLDSLIKMHKESTKERLGAQRLPKLIGVTKEEFFDDNVRKYYDHDDIHQWFAHKEKPM